MVPPAASRPATPVAGCVDSMLAERRAKAFTAGTVKGAVTRGTGDDAARFYAAEGAKVLQAYFHAAALTGRSIEDVLEWVANPRGATTPEEILRSHPHAAPFWHGLLHGRGGVPGSARVALQGAVQQPVPQRRGLRVAPQDVGRGGRGLRMGRPLEDVLDGATGQRGGVEVGLQHLGRLKGVEAGRAVGNPPR